MIAVSAVVKRYGEVTAVDGVSFSVRKGETYGLLGPNGAGKTTTMRMLCGLSPITSGTITVSSLDVALKPRDARAIIGVVSQKDGLDSDLTPHRNLALHGYIIGMPLREANARAKQVLEFFGLSERAKGEVDALSGGMKRRLAIARAFMGSPLVMVLDEPTTGLDPQSRNRVWEQLAVLKSSGVTVLMSTHYMEEAATLCDRVAIMDHGKVLDEGTPDELIARVAGEQVAQVRVDDAARPAVRAALLANGYAFTEVGAIISVTFRAGQAKDIGSLPGMREARIYFRPSNLEDVFLALTGRELRDE
jgi:lipooligosaccharide transport system ATP-binding protein